MSSNAAPLIFISRGSGKDLLVHAVSLLPCAPPLEYCDECGSYYDEMCCDCCEFPSLEFDGIPHTSLPVSIPSDAGNDTILLPHSKFFVTDWITENKLKIQLAVLVNRWDSIKGGENVCVRIHSECLTGDLFYSLKCDCGSEKLQFMRIMACEDKSSRPSLFLYIKGHEGRGAGLLNKIRAYQHLDENPTQTHVDALHAVGCETDVREYGAAVRFVKHKLLVKSVRVWTNNPHKRQVIRDYFGSQCSFESMPAVRSQHNQKYLEEKVKIFGHDGLL